MTEENDSEQDGEPVQKRKKRNKKVSVCESTEEDETKVSHKHDKKKSISDEDGKEPVSPKKKKRELRQRTKKIDYVAESSDEDEDAIGKKKTFSEKEVKSKHSKKKRKLSPPAKYSFQDDSDDAVESTEEDVIKVKGKKKKVQSSEEEDENNSEGLEKPKRTLHSRGKTRYEEDSDFIVSDDHDEDEDEDEADGMTNKSKQHSTPNNRKSSRLHSRDLSRQNKKIPNRRDYLEKISPKCTGSRSTKVFSSNKRASSSNNFVMSRHAYNTEKTYELDDSFVVDEDFIASEDAEEDDSEEEEHRKRKKRKKSQKHKVKKVKKVKKIDTDSEEDISGIEEVNRDSEEELNKKENKKTERRLKSESPLSPEETKKIFPKRTKNKKHYEKSLEKLRKRRDNKSKNEMSSGESEDYEEEDDEGIWGGERGSGSVEDDFIVNDEYDRYDDDDEDNEEKEDVDKMLKDAIAGLKTKNKVLKKTAPLMKSTPLKTSHKTKKGRVLCDDSSSSSEELTDGESSMSELDKKFMDLVSKNDISGVKDLLKTHDLVNKVGKGGKTALHIAAMLGYLTMVELFISKSANTKVEDKLNYSPLGYAAKNKHPNCFEYLLKKADLATFCRNLYKNFDGISLLLLIVSEPLTAREHLDKDIVTCLGIVYTFNQKMFMKNLSMTDFKSHTPLRIAIMQDQVEVVRYLLKFIFDKKNPRNECDEFTTDIGGNILHLATQYSRDCLTELIPYLSHRINERDDSGFTPLMYAAEQYSDCVEVLLNFNASVHVKDNDGVTALHLAASCGNLQSIKLLLDFGHKVSCIDRFGWPPLLYANFRASEECVITLFEKNPSQIFCLGNLINEKNEERRNKNAKIIQETLLSISHIDAYYTLFNDFIGSNLSLLDENNHGCFTKTWRVILSFKNKLKWLRRKCNESLSSCYVDVDRSRVLQSAMEQLPHIFSLQSMNVTFVGEAGSCLGPKREFCGLLIKDIIRPKTKLFTKTDGEQYFPIPNSYFYERMQKNPKLTDQKEREPIGDGFFSDEDVDANITDLELTALELAALPDGHLKDVTCKQEGGSWKRIITKTMKEYKRKLDERLEMMRFVGQFAAQVIMDEEVYVSLQLSKPFVKQILGIPLNHPDDFSAFDHQVFSNIKDNEIEELELPFSTEVSNPWNKELDEILLGDEKHELITEENKQEYLKCLSEFKLCDSTSKELTMFKKGFFHVIRKDVISIFNADEFSLLLNGVTKIDIKDWRNNTTYTGWSSSSVTINWFWSTVRNLKEEEKSLLLKFTTGSPCVPAEGFSQLMGLGGPTLFTICKGNDVDKLPEAGTCFNRLSLPAYTSEKALREKLLIAIRHGCEGFAFA